MNVYERTRALVSELEGLELSSEELKNRLRSELAVWYYIGIRQTNEHEKEA